jgi:pimeloyl-ACP methyl ester carboxylesterase
MIDKTLSLGDETLHYADFGGRGATIVLVHGLGGSHKNWLAVGDALSEHGRVVAIDLPGFGLSPRPKRGSSVDVLGESLAGFIDAISSEPVHLVGNSLGGALTVLEAARRPARVRSALLVCPALPPVPFAPPSPRLLGTLAMAFAPFGSALLGRRARRTGPRQMVHDLLALCCVDPSRVPREVVDAHVDLASTRASRPWADRAFAEAARSVVRLVALDPRYRSALRSLDVPTLVVHGVEDRLVSVRAARAVAARAPRLRLVELPDVGHTPQLEVPTKLVELAAAFFASTSASR